MDGFLLMDDGSAAARARRFREKAEEIRRAARLANSLDVAATPMLPLKAGDESGARRPYGAGQRIGSLQILARLAPSIFEDDLGKRNTANWSEPAHRVTDRQQGIRVDARWQAERGLGFFLELQASQARLYKAPTVCLTEPEVRSACHRDWRDARRR